ncbi:phage portal protein [Mesorhizobium sp. B4-1-1]|uniref:phage portal protein n=1 Tax=Mesorhizobium sp. B4-1-1 TaxID=2589890 RepID=UPI00112D3838|nr:phage portal protein [Mesorhizobium sp. B4-1-1]TPI16580.1 phage portal protein [Mesorhizobium sp. B4-1-1]
MAGLLDRAKAAYHALRGLEAAAPTRRWRDTPQPRAEASYVSAGASVVAARAQNYVMNNATGARIAQALPDQLVGTGIVPRAGHPVETVRKMLARGFSLWADQADADGRCDFFGIQLGLVRDMVVLGEGLGVWMADAMTGAPQMRRLHPEQLDRSKSDGRLINDGVEFDAFGRIVAYWIRRAGPNLDALSAAALAPERWPAADVVHIFRPLFPGQIRGLSWLTPVLVPANTLVQLIDAMIERCRVSALHVGFIVAPDGEPVYEGETYNGTTDVAMEPGAMVDIPPGTDVRFSEPPDAGNVPEFVASILRMIAAGVGMAAEQLSGDYSQVNYSSARAALLEFRRFAQTIQHQVIVFQLCRPAWRRFLLWQVLSGRISATAFRTAEADFMAVKWLPPKWDWVDPLKDSEAAVLQINNRLVSRAQVVAEQGYDIEELDAEIAADQARMKRLGIEPVVLPAAPAPSPEPAP